MAPRAGFEPATNRLTVDCSTAELSRNTVANLMQFTGCDVKQELHFSGFFPVFHLDKVVVIITII